MMALAKGAGLEELARSYFARQGFVAIRSVSIQFEEEEVTDIDVWLYGRQGGGARTRCVSRCQRQEVTQSVLSESCGLAGCNSHWGVTGPSSQPRTPTRRSPTAHREAETAKAHRG